jgi:hypothetical protein
MLNILEFVDISTTWPIKQRRFVDHAVGTSFVIALGDYGFGYA